MSTDTDTTTPGGDLGAATWMPGVRIPMITEADAQGAAAAMFEQTKAALGLPFVPDMFRLTSTRPDLMKVLLTGFGGVFSGGVLPRDTKELIAAWSSKVNGCMYCVGTHNWFLLQFGGTQELADAITNSSSPEELPVDEKTKKLMVLITKVSVAAYKITDDDWNEVTAAGWTDAEMLEAIFTSGLFAFINRMVDASGLGTAMQRSKIAEQSATEAEATEEPVG